MWYVLLFIMLIIERLLIEMIKVLGIIGGIVIGKSMVVVFFKKVGYLIVDGDIIVCEIVVKG